MPGQHQVEQEQVRRLAADRLQAGVPAVRDLDLEALFLEVVLQHLGDVGLVLDQQNAFACHVRQATTESSTGDAENSVEKRRGNAHLGAVFRGFPRFDQSSVQSL